MFVAIVYTNAAGLLTCILTQTNRLFTDYRINVFWLLFLLSFNSLTLSLHCQLNKPVYL